MKINYSLIVKLQTCNASADVRSVVSCFCWRGWADKGRQDIGSAWVAAISQQNTLHAPILHLRPQRQVIKYPGIVPRPRISYHNVEKLEIGSDSTLQTNNIKWYL